ncbi:hypothetical protein M406DRAFT_346591 [Cryphonectria parasitica EP155]|uniref:Helicase C-terminal domain-containing protein n=1 Tax=Cryphonectria parasitica (strain ATCC 38755 / EP155) TaxID=660469 RepID=A0A9P4Y1P4_CRYP1|nr:uncharacterized protein M406DRAFT_346591 [Cryphonectria parasitica EP155]KAF3764535.1 hypothetical protein M406DRAFT_346591 [Cryphonectria parasitica EP155]
MGKPKSRNQAREETAQHYSIRIIGKLISKAGFFLQHPTADEAIPGVQYDNPHYLLPPGAGMPKLKNLRLSDEEDVSSQLEPGDETSKSYLLQIFEAAEADGETVKVVNTSPSSRLRSRLMSHQLTALAMMLEKESGHVEQPVFPPLWRTEFSENRKVLHVLALICASLDLQTATEDHAKKTSHRGTLIVAPMSTIRGWMIQASQHIHKGQVRVQIYHGSGRQGVANEFVDTNVVITTYETLRSEWAITEGARPIYSWKWLRTYQSVWDLNARYRWCLTGTPIHNSLDDYGALLSFIRVFPFVQKSKFMTWIANPVEEKDKLGIERLHRLVRATCLRRTIQKALSSGMLKLPQRSERIHEGITIRAAAGLERRPDQGPSPKGKQANILALINSLRLICDHGEHLLSKAGKARTWKLISWTKAVSNVLHRPSAKVLALLENLRMERTAAGANRKPRKSVGFSYWIKMLDLIEQALYGAQVSFQRIDGHTSREGREKAVQKFNDNPDCTVMLASIGSAAEGIDLVAASVVHLIEPHWNPMVEAQAVDRVYRIGQMQEVTVIRYIVPNSVETYIQKVQKDKLEMIDQTMNMRGMTEADLESKRWKVLMKLIQ